MTPLFPERFVAGLIDSCLLLQFDSGDKIILNNEILSPL
jgi:hypothetical protein